MKQPTFIFFAFAAHGTGISGSDRIFIELAKRWSKKTSISLYVFPDGKNMSVRNGLTAQQVTFHTYANGIFDHLGFFIQYLANILHALIIASCMRLSSPEMTICYSASEFWMDSLPAWILKIRYPQMRWVASWYQTAPNPLIGFREGKREKTYRAHALVYFLMQLPIKRIIRHRADYVIVNNTKEQEQFPYHAQHKRTIVLLGAVDIASIEAFKKRQKKLVKQYDAVFQGRFHPQKGVVELVQIWHLVVSAIPNAVLVMIGDGPLFNEVKQTIVRLKLQKNILLTGYLFDGEEKYTLLKQSKVVLHPSFYDSGGMAAAEAMAFGLPCVGFDLQSYASYYPKGMLKVETGNLQQFAETVIELLKNKEKRHTIGTEAEDMIRANYDWDQRAEEVIKKIL